LLISFAISQIAYSQGFHTSNNRALKVYNEGLAAYDFFDFKKAEAYFTEAVKLDDGFYEGYIMLGELFSKQKRYSEASINFRKAVRLDSLFFKPVYFSLAYAELMSGDYQNALVHFNVYLAQSGMSEKNRIIAIKNVKNCEFALKAIENPVLFNPVSAGNTINTRDDEYWPSITADGNMLMFTRQLNPAERQGRAAMGHEDFYVSYSSDDGWKEAFNAGPPLNTSQNEGAASISSNGNYMFFTACDRRGGMGSCDIYFSSLNGGRWSEPFNLGMPVNTSYWESQPSISADGKRLFFSSSRPGGEGGKDIWFSTLNEQNMWTEPQNMGSLVNTDGDEMSPFIHFDGKTLYFASDGRTGMGGVDLFMTRMNDDSTWAEPQNLGYPINTYNDEMGLIIESGGRRAYFSSVRDKANGKDIFYFNLHESIRPNPVAYLKGKVYDKVTGKLLKAEYELINLSTKAVTIQSSTDESGNFLVCLPSGYNYGINVKKSGYLFYSENFMFEGQHSVVEPFIKKIILSPIREGEKMKLANVFYEVDSWQLKSESISELNNLASLISDNTNFMVEIGGFTDSTGTAEYNQLLSEKRAQSVVNFLISKGVSPERLKYKGYGNTLPVGDNKTPEGRKLNRRTEARILELK
jgi:outer membrane protein OmpA-like peptidoglycan-associated protein